MDKKGDQKQDDNAVLGHLSQLNRLAEMASSLVQLVEMGNKKNQMRGLYLAVSVGSDHRFKFDAESIYIDNLTNSGAITIQFDNEPLQFSIAANTGRFLPCSGAKQFRLNGSIASGSINVMTLNREMGYN